MAETPPHDPAARACEGFPAVFGRPAAGVAFAPGRVNLVGEHTDYNEGFVLPMALERGVAVAFAPGTDRRLRARTLTFEESWEGSLGALERGTIAGWPAYVAGVASGLLEAGLKLAGADLLIDSDLPVASGLSSSAALEAAVAKALCDVAGGTWDGPAVARLCQRAEREFAGVSCGIMDQLASILSREGCALLIDCRTLATEAVPLPEHAAIAVIDSATPRSLAASAYNDRRASCERAVEAIRRVEPSVRALRDVDTGLLERCRGALDATTWRRASHVVGEIARPPAMADALRHADLGRAGRVMNDSHESLRNLYEVSGPELDLATLLAREQRGCYGARMTGAGFGGCAVALVDRAALEGFCRAVEIDYRARSGRPGTVFGVEAGAGVRAARCAG
jgi:galactokinase